MSWEPDPLTALLLDRVPAHLWRRNNAPKLLRWLEERHLRPTLLHIEQARIHYTNPKEN